MSTPAFNPDLAYQGEAPPFDPNAGYDKAAPAGPPADRLPKNWQMAQPTAEEQDFLQKNSGYTWLPADNRFPQREPGIYPTGPGNEWRNDPNHPNASMQQAPVDLHLGQHIYENLKLGVTGATLPLMFEASLPQLIGGLVGGGIGSYGAQKVAKSAGAGEFGQEVAGDVGGVVGGAVGTGAARYATSKARALYEALPSDLQDALKTQLAKAGKDATGAVGGYRLKKAIDLWDTVGELKDRFIKTGGKVQGELDATGKDFPDYAGEKEPKPTPWNAHDATGENKQFAGGMDEFTPKPMRPTVAPSALSLPTPQPAAPSPLAQSASLGIPAPFRAPYSPPPAAPPQESLAGSLVRSVTEPKAPPKADPLLIRLRSIASDIEAHEKGAAQPTTEDDLTGLLLQSLAQVKARKGVQ